MRIVFALALCLLLNSANAADWQMVGVSGDSTLYQIDFSKIEKGRSGLTRFWVKTTYVVPQQIMQKWVTYTVARWYINCKDSAAGRESITHYDSDGHVVWTGVLHYGLAPIVPDSMGEAVADQVCKKNIHPI